MLNHTPLGSQIEIDQHVAAEDNIEALHERHASVVGKIQAAEGYSAANRWLDLQLLLGGSEVFLAVIRSQIAGAITAVDCIPGVRQGTFIQVGGEDLDGPVLETAVHLLRASAC